MNTRSIALPGFVLALFASSTSFAGPPPTDADDEVVIEVEDDDSTASAAPPTPGPGKEGENQVDVEVEVEDEPATGPEGSAPTEAAATDDESGPSSTSTADVSVAADVAAELSALQARVVELEAGERARLAATREPANTERRFVRFGLARPDLPPTTVGFGPSLGVRDWGVRLSGYLQLQYVHSQLSRDELEQGGEPLNRDRFMVRRGRLRVSGDWQWAAFDFEIDGSTTRGPFVGIRQANASFVWRHRDRDRPPLLMVSAGLTEMPFGYEMRLGQREMPFMERSAGSLALFPGPIDVGVRLRGALGPFRYDLAVMGGTPYDDRAGGARSIDPTRKPDGMGRLGFEVRPGKRTIALAGGVSGLLGTGFHAGQQAGKSRLEWIDLNENGVLDSGETVAIPGTAATPSLTFERWAVGLDLQLAIRSKAGWSTLMVEGTLASNLDRDFLVADPIAYGADLRELSVYAAFVQELFGWALIGARYDYYDPNTDLLDRRRGAFVPASAALHTLSPLLGALLPAGKLPGFRARLMVQYDAIWDRLGRDVAGVPTNLRNDQLTLRVQGEF
ncbi:hypothetical protein ACNOYE_35565 [Nannocystaceae bacterium ST9]